MGDLSTNFSRREFRCKGRWCCAHTSVPDDRIIEAMEHYRAIVGGPITPWSAFRCVRYNRRVGSKDSSEHVWGRAVDIHTLPGMTVEGMAAAAEKVPAFRDGGIGLYDWGIHVDVRPDGPARWDYRSKAA